MAQQSNIRLVTAANNAATQITASAFCHSVQVGEDASVVGWPTTDYTVAKPNGNNNATIPFGQKYTFIAPWPFMYRPGDAVGSLQTISATSTFFIDES